MRKVLYFAAPLFSDAERAFNAELCERLEKHVDVFLPQRDGFLLSNLLREGASVDVATAKVFECDVAAVTNADGLLMVLDGRGVDEGAAFELGLAFSQGKKCVGLQTDVRRLFAVGNNPMLTGAISEIFKQTSDLVDWTRFWATET